MFTSEIKFAMTKNYKRNYVVNKHQHPCYEIVFYIDGEGESIINNTAYKFKPNTFTICNPNTFHKEIGYTKVELIYIGFDIINESVKLDEGIYDNNDFDILGELLEIHKELENKKDFYEKMANILISKILIKLKRTSTIAPKTETSVVEKIIEYIKLNCMKNINAKDLANTFSFNYDYLRRMFKEKTGISIKDYIQKEKLHYAIDLLKNTSFSIKEVSSLAGFSSPSHFATVFKSELNITPKEYVSKYLSSNPHQEIADFDGNQILFMED